MRTTYYNNKVDDISNFNKHKNFYTICFNEITFEKLLSDTSLVGSQITSEIKLDTLRIYKSKEKTLIVGHKITYNLIYGHFLYLDDDDYFIYKNVSKDADNQYHKCSIDNLVKTSTEKYIKLHSIEEYDYQIKYLRQKQYKEYQDFLDKIAQSTFYEIKEDPNNYKVFYEYVDDSILSFSFDKDSKTIKMINKTQ